MQWRGHLCKYPDHGDPDPYPWHALTPYGTDPTGDTWIFSRAWFFSGPDLQTWSVDATGPWWIQATGNSGLYWWWSGSTWQGPFQPDWAYTPNGYSGRAPLWYEAVVTEVWLWNGQWSGPYYHLETASGLFALLDPNWACATAIL